MEIRATERTDMSLLVDLQLLLLAPELLANDTQIMYLNLPERVGNPNPTGCERNNH